MPSYLERRANCLRYVAVNTPANLARLARQYEATYRRWRRSLSQPQRDHLIGALLTARAFYSLARERAQATG